MNAFQPCCAMVVVRGRRKAGGGGAAVVVTERCAAAAVQIGFFISLELKYAFKLTVSAGVCIS
jgi:hypothetical protein